MAIFTINSLLALLLPFAVSAASEKGKVQYEAKGVVLLDSITYPEVIYNLQPSSRVLVGFFEKQSLRIGFETEETNVRSRYLEFAVHARRTKDANLPNLLFSQVLVNGAENKNIKLQTVGDRKLPVFAFLGENKTSPVVLELPSLHEYRYSSFLGFLNENGYDNILPGVIPEFDVLAKKFLASSPDEKEQLVVESELLYSKITEKNILVYGESYTVAMKGIIADGLGHLKSEGKRFIDHLRSDSVEEERKDYMIKRINILDSFLRPHSQSIYELASDTFQDEL